MANHPEEGKRAVKYGYKVAVPRASAQAHDKLGRIKTSTPKVSIHALSGHALSGRLENDYASARVYGFVPEELAILRLDEGDEDESSGVAWSAAARAFADVTERFEQSEAVLAELERAVEETSR